MYIYNVTTHVEPSIENEWLNWMEKHHLPEMMKTGQFTQARLFRVVNDQDHGGISYATQYYCADKKHYTTYINEYATALRQKAVYRFGAAILSFRTQLEEMMIVQ